MADYVGGEIATIHVSALAAYQARAFRISELTAELERMGAVRKGADAGELAPLDIPSDAYTYYGKSKQVAEEIRELQVPQRQYEQAQYNRAMGDVQEFAAGEQRQVLGSRNPETFSELQAIAHDERREITLRAAGVLDASISPWLSNDDYVFAYQKGANSELSKWYWEQKREHGFGNARAESTGIVTDHEPPAAWWREFDSKFQEFVSENKSAFEGAKAILQLNERPPELRERMEGMLRGEWKRLREGYMEPIKAWEVAARTIAVREVSENKMEGNMSEKQMSVIEEVAERLGYRPDPKEVAEVYQMALADQNNKRDAAINQVVDHYETWDRGLIETGEKSLREYYPAVAGAGNDDSIARAQMHSPQEIATAMVSEHVSRAREATAEAYVPVNVIADILSRHQEEIRTKAEWAVPKVESGAATSYLRGHAESNNTFIRELSERYPGIAKDLPAEMNINSIEARSMVPERRHERAIAI